MFTLLSLIVSVTPFETLSGTEPLTMQGDIAQQMVEGISKYLDRELSNSLNARDKFWKRQYGSKAIYESSVSPNRERLKKIIGAVDIRESTSSLEYILTTDTPALISDTDTYSIYRVRWKVFHEVYGEGLLLEPREMPVAQVVAIPDADQTPEMISGLSDALPLKAQFARRLAEQGCRVVVPVIIDRSDKFSGNPRIRMTNQPHREYIYRMSFELGRHIIGYEVQKVLAVVDYFCKAQLPIGVMGYGEGGLIAFYSGAIDLRISSVVVSGYFDSRTNMWSEPIYRNVWGFLREFGDAEVASLVAPRTLVVEASDGPVVSGPPEPRDGRSGAAPGSLPPLNIRSVRSEFERAKAFYDKLGAGDKIKLIEPDDGLSGSDMTIIEFLSSLGHEAKMTKTDELPDNKQINFDVDKRQREQIQQLVDFTQRLLRESVFRRREFWAKADMSSLDRWVQSAEEYRVYLWEEVIGKLPEPEIPINPRSRLSYDQPKWKGYEVVLDVFPDVFAYGILLVPKDISKGERRPVVVCQHGLEGRPTQVVEPSDEPPYNGFGAKLADIGFVVFAPQNPYIGGDNFRVLQRKANPLKLSLFSFIVRQHQRILEWLSGLPFVDPNRIGFYGISYGGKTAMRVPAILKGYALSICSADFNEWIMKNVTVDYPYSYIFTGEYEMFEFDLGSTFNYSDLAGLILPRPFMVERGHHDGVAPDEWVAYEYATVRRLYTVLGIPERTTIEFFNGGHQINAKGTFEFIKKWLNFP